MDDYHAGKFYIDEMKLSPTVWVNIFIISANIGLLVYRVVTDIVCVNDIDH